MTDGLKELGKVIQIGSKQELQPHSATLPKNLQPIDPKALAVKLAETLALWKVPDDWSAAKADWYREALADLPDDLVDLALRHARMNYKFFPKPAELREPVQRILSQRRDLAADRAQRERDIAKQMAERDAWLARERERLAEVAAATTGDAR